MSIADATLDDFSMAIEMPFGMVTLGGGGGQKRPSLAAKWVSASFVENFKVWA
jgi:hypothetical protein